MMAKRTYCLHTMPRMLSRMKVLYIKLYCILQYWHVPCCTYMHDCSIFSQFQSVWHSMCAARVREERVCKTVAVTENDDQLWSCAPWGNRHAMKTTESDSMPLNGKFWWEEMFANFADRLQFTKLFSANILLYIVKYTVHSHTDIRVYLCSC